MCNRVKEHVYTVFFAFAGIGGGAIGFQQAAVVLEKFGLKGRFRVIGAAWQASRVMEECS